jgi:integrase
MIYALKPVCKKDWKRKDGTSKIFIQYCRGTNQRVLIDTEMAIPPEHWNKKPGKVHGNLPSLYGDADDLNERLHKMLRIAEDIISFCFKNTRENPLSFLKKTFTPDLDVSILEQRKSISGNLDVYFQFDDYIESKKRRIAASTVHIYMEVKRYLQAFEKFRGRKITFKSFDVDFYHDFVDFMTFDYESYRYTKTGAKGLKRNTMGKAIKHLRLFLKDRIRRKIIPPIDLTEYKVFEEIADATYLTNYEVEEIYKLDLSLNPKLEIARDLLVLGCFTGLRFSDFSSIKPEDIRNGKLHIKQQKSDHWVVIPLRPTAHEILINKFRGQIPRTSNADFNGDIKKICQIAGIDESIKFSYKKGNRDIEEVKPKYKWVTSHSCRRSFCTNEFLAGTPVELIMKISGHRSLKDFYRYIKVTPDQAAYQIEKIWKERELITAAQPVG